jgi:dihydrofolate reductase
VGEHISFVVAVAENGVIGRAGALPWRISSDLRMFRRITMGKPVIMGRKTFDSLPRVLDGRDLIVVTRDTSFAAAGVSAVGSFPEALALARRFAAKRGVDEITVIGGADVFRLALPSATRMYWTDVHGSPPGDVFFPKFDRTAWRVVSETPLPRSEKDEFAATLKVLERQPV